MVEFHTYFHKLGKICDRSHEYENTGQSMRYKVGGRCVECQKISQQSEKSIASRKVAQKKYRQSDKGRAYQKAYSKSDVYKDCQSAYARRIRRKKII